jgi:hypothetical protein
MANNISSNPWLLNTAPFTYNYPVKITNLNITDATTGDHIVITDINNNTIVDFTANSAELDYRIGTIGWVRGIKVASGGFGTSGTANVSIAVGAGR